MTRAIRLSSLSRISASKEFHRIKRNPPKGHVYFVSRASAHLHDDIDQRRLSAFHHLDRIAQRLAQILRLRHGPRRPYTVRFRIRREIDGRLFDADAHRLVLYRTLAQYRHALLVLLVVVVRAVAIDDDQERNLVMRRGPERADRKEQTAVRLDVDAEFARALVRERRAERSGNTVAQAAARSEEHTS